MKKTNPFQTVKLILNEPNDFILTKDEFIKNNKFIFGVYDGGGPDEPVSKYLIIPSDCYYSCADGTNTDKQIKCAAIGLNHNNIIYCTELIIDDETELIKFNITSDAIKWLFN